MSLSLVALLVIYNGLLGVIWYYSFNLDWSRRADELKDNLPIGDSIKAQMALRAVKTGLPLSALQKTRDSLEKIDIITSIYDRITGSDPRLVRDKQNNYITRLREMFGAKKVEQTSLNDGTHFIGVLDDPRKAAKILLAGGDDEDEE